MENKTLPDGWQWKKLGEACELNPPKSEVRNLEDCLVSFVPMADLKEKQKFFESKQEKKLSEVYSGYTYFAENDVLLAKVTPCFENGKSGIARNLKNGKGFGSSEYYVLRGNEKILNEWIYYIIADNSFLNLGAENMSGAVGLKRVTKDFLYNYPIPLPPLEEQKRIVAKIDAAFEQLDEAISLQKNNILRTETLKKALLVDIFEGLHEKFEVKKLSTFGKITSGGTPSRQIKEYWNGDIEWFSSGELNTTKIFESKDKITQLGLSNSNAKVFPVGTLLIGMYDTAAMKMSILGKEAACNQAIVGITPPPNKLNTFFLKSQLEYLKSEILLQRQGVRQQNLNAQKIKDIEIALPPIAEQEKIVAYLDKSFAEIDEMLEAQKIRLAHLEVMKKAILQEAFEGKL